MDNKELFFKILDQEMIRSTGCTEPAAISYTASIAANELKKLNDEINFIHVTASKNVLKNAMSAGLPNSNKVGVRFAAAIGAIHGNPANKLDVNNDVDNETYRLAEKMIKDDLVIVDVANVPNVLYIEIKIQGKSHISKVVIQDSHTNVSLIEVDGKILYEKKDTDKTSNVISASTISKFLNLKKIYDFATKELDTTNDPIDILKLAAKINSAISEEGLKNDYGLKVGKNIYNEFKGNLSTNYTMHAIMNTTAASDARMSGAPFSVVTNSGSGNQGITNVVPIVTLSRDLNVSEDKKYRALALANLTSIYIKSQFGTLSAFCGAAIASMGAATGITYLKGGDYNAYEMTINNMIGTVTGMLCDGAKPDCSLKIYVGLQSAFTASSLAMQGIRVKSTEGIVCESAEDSIKNLCRLSKDCSEILDKNIIDMMIVKH